MTELLLDFEKHLHFLHFSPKAIKSYLGDLKIFFTTANCTTQSEIVNIDKNKLREFVSHEKGRVGNRTINRRLSAIKKFYEFLSIKNEKKFQIIDHVRYLKTPALLPKALEQETIQEILNALQNKKTPWKRDRDTLLIQFLFTTGARLSECLGVKFSDILGLSIKIISKGGNEDYLHITEQMEAKINNLKNSYPFLTTQDSFVFMSKEGKALSGRYVQKLLQDISGSVNSYTAITPHKIRHTIATTLLENGMNILSIKKFLRHRNLTTTEKYTKIRAKEIIKKMDQVGGVYELIPSDA